MVVSREFTTTRERDPVHLGLAHLPFGVIAAQAAIQFNTIRLEERPLDARSRSGMTWKGVGVFPAQVGNRFNSARLPCGVIAAQAAIQFNAIRVEERHSGCPIKVGHDMGIEGESFLYTQESSATRLTYPVVSLQRRRQSSSTR
jgi:hypothetical protein